jgi:hypothetical protein
MRAWDIKKLIIFENDKSWLEGQGKCTQKNKYSTKGSKLSHTYFMVQN